jgi:hypothetical protein
MDVAERERLIKESREIAAIPTAVVAEMVYDGLLSPRHLTIHRITVAFIDVLDNGPREDG